MIEAAGGVVLRGDGDGREVLVVHRVRHRDWSLPKGKLEAGEKPRDAALREVEEETGVRATLGAELPGATYRVGEEAKHVHWYLMSAVDGDPGRRPPDAEVDVARWVAVEDAFALLTYTQDVELLRHAVTGGTP